VAKLKAIFITTHKRHKGDCAVAALATLLRVPYEEMLVAAAKVQPLVLVRGLHNDEIIEVAAAFGRVLVEESGTELDLKATGILGGKLASNTGEDEHAVVVSGGILFDPDDGEVWRVKDYIKHYGMTEVDMLELED